MTTDGEYLLNTLSRMAEMHIRCVLALALCLATPVASSQDSEQKAASQTSTLSGHYVGAAVSKTGRSIPLSLDVTCAQQKYSGAITTAFGVFTISGPASAGSLPVVLALSGEAGQGTITLSAVGAQLEGVYALADDSGSVSLGKTSEKAQSSEASSTALKVPILFLGVYHMANPELDAVPFVADDVLKATRQQQIEELIVHLQQFHPTKVLVEAPYGDQGWQAHYEAYLKGDERLGPNEIEQLGFRIAKAEHLSHINGIDYPMFLNGLRPDETRLPDHSGPSQTDRGANLKTPSREEKILQEMTISQYLVRMNSPENLAAGQSQYMAMLLPDKQADLYRGADQVGNWYKRNLRIMENINRYAKPGDRILVIIGAGHVPLLREFAAESSYFTVIDPIPFLTSTSH